MYNYLRYILILVCCCCLNGQQIHLNEIVSSNGSTIVDEDGETPDWIEIYNPSNEAINLSGFGLSDNSEDPYKWLFPSYIINSNEYAIIFASNKDRSDIIAQWDAILDIGDTWAYWVGNSSPVSGWHLPNTDISNWPLGPSGFGYGDNDDNTEIEQTTSIFIKTSFMVEDLSLLSKVLFHIDYDDGYIAYLNGLEFSRSNLGQSGSDINFSETATALHEAEIYSGGFPEAIIVDQNQYPLLEGENTLSIQVHNYTNTSSDLTCIPFLTFGYNVEIEETRVPNPAMLLPSTYLHTNFKISAEGETILLTNEEGQILDSIFTGQLETDMSYGRIIDSSDWALFSDPTPGAPNLTDSFFGVLTPPSFSLESGFYTENQITISIQQVNELSNTYYTLDGSAPDMNSLEYQSPIVLSGNSVIRAKSFLEDWSPSRAESKTFILEESPPEELPVIFLSTDPGSFFDNDTGIYALGSNASNDFPYFGSNFWEDWERPIHFEIVDPNRTGYAADAGVKIFGGWSRAFPQKSLSFFSRSSIGPSNFNYNFFPNSDINQYEAFVLRNSGNDWESTVLRDGFTTSLTEGLNIDHQKYRPAILYINGQFWGIQNIREKINEHFIASNHNIDAQYVDLLVGGGFLDEEIVHGTNTDYINLIGYVESNNMNDDIVENAIENWIDIDSFLSYFAFQIFIDNRDWPGNNIKFWRDHRAGGKWRWILYDTDFGFGIWDNNAFTFNTLDYALESNGPEWPNPPWSTLLFRKIIENNNFKNSFITNYSDMLNTIFKPNHLINHLDSIVSNIEDIIPQHRNRWYNNGSWPNSAVSWENRIANIENFSENRHTYAQNHLQSEFELENTIVTSISILPENSGSVRFNTLTLKDSLWRGYYFPNVPVTAEAVPNEGYIFSHWEEFPDSGSILNLPSVSENLRAVFTQTELSDGDVVINEINYNSSNLQDTGDWIELVNAGDMDINISQWELKDDDDEHSFIIPDGSFIPSNGFLVIAEDISLFSSVYPNIINALGSFNFGLSGGGDQIRIYNNFGQLIDSLEYDDAPPWPVEPDGEGYTLELFNIEDDNTLPESWVCSTILYGSPGSQNTFSLNVTNDNKLIPNETRLGVPYPNPFNGTISLPIQLSNDKSGKIIIFNIKGEIITEILLSEYTIGTQMIYWNGKNQKGQSISTGIYFVSLNNNINNIQKIIYLK